MSNTNMVFPNFPKLPAELRLKIWQLALTPRLVTFQPEPFTFVNYGEGPQECHEKRSDKFTFLPNQALACLSANKEANLALSTSYYHPLTNTDTRTPIVEESCTPFNSDLDTLYMNSLYIPNFLLFQWMNLDCLRYVALYDRQMLPKSICKESYYPSREIQFYSTWLFRKCSNLERLYICLFKDDKYPITEYMPKVEKTMRAWRPRRFPGRQDVLHPEMQLTVVGPRTARMEAEEKDQQRWDNVLRLVFYDDMKKERGLMEA